MDVPINRSIWFKKANDLAEKLKVPDFKAINGWLTRRKDCHGIEVRKLHGVKQNPDELGAKSWIEGEWSKILERFSPDDIFNMDETGLYYRATLDSCKTFKNYLKSAGKKRKNYGYSRLQYDGKRRKETSCDWKNKNPDALNQ